MKLLEILILSTVFTQFTCGLNYTSDNTTHLSRGRRHLDFLSATRVFFRVNIKENIFTWASIWAHAIGFKANVNILNENKNLRPYRRDTYEVLQELLDLHGLDGQACILKAFCTASSNSKNGMEMGFLFKLLRHIFKLDDNDRQYFPHLRDENCNQMIDHQCPLSFNNITPFTDEI